jgi:zinc transporter ZupT
MATCETRFWTTTFLLCLSGLLFLLVSGLFSMLEMLRTSDRRFFIPMLLFVACVMMSAGLFDYASWSNLNSHSSRAMVTSIVFAYAALPISAFVAGRYSAYDRYMNNGQMHNGQKYLPTATNGN